MLEITSTGCGEFHHAEFRLRLDADSALERDARELIACLERRVASGHPFRHGDHLPYGWMDLRFRQLQDCLFAVEEPDLLNLPVRYTDSVTNSLCHLRWQKTCASMLAMQQPLTPPAMTQTAAICPQLKNTSSFFMERTDNSDSNSGWFIGCAEPVHDHANSRGLIRAPLYEILLGFDSAIAAFLALPPGAKVLNGRRGLWISCGGRSHRIPSGSFLDHLVNGSRDSGTPTILIDDSHNLLQSPPGRLVPTYQVPLPRRLVVRTEADYIISPPREIASLRCQKPNTALLLTRNGNFRQDWNEGYPVEFDLSQEPLPLTPGTSLNASTGKSGDVESPPLSPSPSPAPGTDRSLANLKPGDELILLIGYMDPRPVPITKGGIAAMWSARLKITPPTHPLPSELHQ